MRIRFHSVGGYGTIATGKLLTDILAGVLGMHSKSAPKYGSEKSGAPTNYYITLSPEPVLLTNAELEDVEIVVSPDHKSFIHANPLKGLVEGGTFILQSDLPPDEVWRELPKHARKTIRDKKIHFFVIDAFSVAKKHAPSPELQLRMMGIAFIGAVVGNVDRVTQGASEEAVLEKVRTQISKKFGGKGAAVVEGNMAVIREGIEAVRVVEYDDPAFLAIEEEVGLARTLRSVALSASMCTSPTASASSGLFDPAYYEDLVARPFREGTMAEAPVLPGIGLFMPAGTSAGKDKGLFRLHRARVPLRHLHRLHGVRARLPRCGDPQQRPRDPRPPAHRHQGDGRRRLHSGRSSVRRCTPLAERVREAYRQDKAPRAFHEVVAEVAEHPRRGQPDAAAQPRAPS